MAESISANGETSGISGRVKVEAAKNPPLSARLYKLSSTCSTHKSISNQYHRSKPYDGINKKIMCSRTCAHTCCCPIQYNYVFENGRTFAN